MYRKTSFEKESADLLSLTDKPLNLTTFHKNISKKKGRGGGLAQQGGGQKMFIFSGGGGGCIL